MKKFDVFISHASEDKDSVVTPLAESLQRLGLVVWIDQTELRVGDSLREGIDRGLRQSRYGIVVLSPSFMKKRWPKRELNALFAAEEGGENVILPVWHEIERDAVFAFSPMLADRIAARTSSGLVSVARQIADVVQKTGFTATLAEVVDAGPELERLSTLLAMHPSILRLATGQSGLFGMPDVIQDPSLEPFHLVSFIMCGTDGSHEFMCTAFMPSTPSEEEEQDLPRFLDECRAVIDQANQQPAKTVRSLIPHCDSRITTSAILFRAAVFFGRRGQIPPGALEAMTRHKESYKVNPRSYDHLLDVSMMIETGESS